MRVELCARIYEYVCVDMRAHMRIDICVDLYGGMYEYSVETCDMCIAMCIKWCTNMCIDMCAPLSAKAREGRGSPIEHKAKTHVSHVCCMLCYNWPNFQVAI